MGFEKFGEEGCLNPCNLKRRDRVAIIGAAPGFAYKRTLGVKRMKANQAEEEDTDDDDGLSESSLKSRRKLKKKRRDFFKTFSDAESTAESSNVSSSDITDSEVKHSFSPLNAPIPRISLFQSELSEDGYITDASTVSQLMKRFYRTLPSNRSPTHKFGSYSPEKLNIDQLGKFLVCLNI